MITSFQHLKEVAEQTLKGGDSRSTCVSFHLKHLVLFWPSESRETQVGKSGTFLTQNEGDLSRREQDLQAAVEEWQQILSIGTAELNKQLPLPATEGRLLRPVEHQNLTGHLTGNRTNNTQHHQSRRAG